MASTYAAMPSQAFPRSDWDPAVHTYDEQKDFDNNVQYAQSRTMPRSLHNQKSEDWTGARYDQDTSTQPHAPRTQQPVASSAEKGFGEHDAGWIHRDKLAQIESKEMAEAGIRTHQTRHRANSRPPSRTTSRSASRHESVRKRSRERYGNRESPGTSFPDYDMDRSKSVPPVAKADEDMGIDQDSTTRHEFGMRRDHGAERPIPQYSRSVARPNTSRIPISRNSPAPVTNGLVERESPMIRNRNTSNNWNARPEDDFQDSRRRSQSLGNSAVMDGIPRPRSSMTRSRPASSHIQNSTNDYMTSSPTSTSGRAKTPASQPSGKKSANGTRVVSQSKSRTSSTMHKGSPSTQRPVSSGRLPGPINRPEGDAPWLATMYKPDPRLPPDQQVIPTHAKRMMNEREGTPEWNQDAYYPSFEEQPPLRLDTGPGRHGSISPVEQRNSLAEPPWPLEHRSSDARSGASGGGGYSLTPTIPISPQLPVISATQRQPVTRVPDLDEKDESKQKKGCCCIVM